MRRSLQRVGIQIENLLWHLSPGHCLLCDLPSQRRRDLCLPCSEDLPWLRASCTRCALPLTRPVLASGSSHSSSRRTPALPELHDDSGRAVCGACFSKPPPFARAVCPFRFDAEIGAWLGSIKRSDATAPARVLGELFAEHVLTSRLDEPMPDALIPVPLSRRRQAIRGHNQAETLARRIAPALGLPVRRQLHRVRHTPTQQGLSRSARLRNLQGAFSAADSVRGAHLALIDDVMTTGSTLRQATRALLRAGATRVEVWPIARASGDHPRRL